MNESPRFLHTVIRASAGTGKTYQLSSRYIGLLAAGVAPEQILATTFTRKAAGEILDRVLLRLAQAASDEAACRQLAGAIDDTQFTRARARQLLAATSRNLHRLRVGTLDSYFLQVAGGFALELGLPAGWSICDELLDQTLREDAIEEVLARGKLPELRTLVHLLAKGEAVRSVSSVIQATVRSVYATYRQSEPPAWQQIPQPKGLEEQELAATIDQLAAYPLPGAQWTKARDADVQNALLGNWEALIDKGIAGKVLAGEANYNRKPIPDDLVALYERLLAHVASVLVGQLARQTQATRQLLERFAEHYAAAQAEQRALRFDDVTHYLAAATAFNSPRQQAYRLDGLIRHLLLDEFQDTAPTQWRVLRPLAQSLIGQEDASFFSVGDTKQAIYGWRGGVAEIFDALDGELPGLAHESLAHSYRSSQPVIDAVNRAFQYLTRHPNLDKLEPAVAQWQAKFPAHSTARSELPGHVRLEFAPLTDEGVPQADAVFEYAADQVAQHVRRASQCSVGVLVRTNAAVARMIYLLRQRDVPASEEGGNPLTDSPAVELVLSLLRLADHPGDSAARFHLAWSPLAEALELADHTDARAASKLARSIRRIFNRLTVAENLEMGAY
ncbi:MAG: UvrD-helicase domain-containing protein, partial [Pirellulaceae bacterium]